MALIKNFNVGSAINLPDPPTADNKLHITTAANVGACYVGEAYANFNVSLQSGGSENRVYCTCLCADGSVSEINSGIVTSGQTKTVSIPANTVCAYFLGGGSIGTNLMAWLS